MTKQRNRGLRKRCECPRKNWAKCSHPWHFNFKWKGEHYRFSLDREVGHPVTSKTEAEKEADRLRTAIREGRVSATTTRGSAGRGSTRPV